MCIATYKGVHALPLFAVHKFNTTSFWYTLVEWKESVFEISLVCPLTFSITLTDDVYCLFIAYHARSMGILEIALTNKNSVSQTALALHHKLSIVHSQLLLYVTFQNHHESQRASVNAIKLAWQDNTFPLKARMFGLCSHFMKAFRTIYEGIQGSNS